MGFKLSFVLQAMQSQGISHAVQLEQWLMEGAYNKVLEARPQLPHPAYSYFMEKLLSTVRCIGVSLPSGQNIQIPLLKALIGASTAAHAIVGLCPCLHRS